MVQLQAVCQRRVFLCLYSKNVSFASLELDEYSVLLSKGSSAAKEVYCGFRTTAEEVKVDGGFHQPQRHEPIVLS